MPTITSQEYKKHLPEISNGFWVYASRFAIIIAIVFPIISLLVTPKMFMVQVYTVYLLVLFSVMAIYLVIQENKKLHRYAYTTICTHYVNHALRDYLEVYKETGRGTNQALFLSNILDGISRCFTLIVGKNCRSSIKLLNPEMEITTSARDTISTVGDDRRIKSQISHKLDDNTDFRDIWGALNGRTRYFFSNNLVKLWSQNKYENSSFEEVGHPNQLFTIGEKKFFIRHWRLPYKSSIVFPIRFLPDSSINSGQDGAQADNTRYWGFLCIDCPSKNVFDPIYSVELGGAFADALYAFFSQLKFINDTSRSQEEPKTS